MIRRREGFTAVESLVTIVISAMLVSASLAVLVSNQKLSDAVSGRIGRSDQLRAAVEILRAETRQIDPADGDLASTSPDTLQIRSLLGTGVACAVSYAGTPTATLRKLGRWIVTGDSLLILADNDPSTAADDRWLRGVAGSVDTTQTCPNGTPAQTVSLPSMASALAIDSIRVGASARSFQWRGYALGMDNGEWYLTLKTPDMLQPEPVAGPFGSPSSSGLRIGYFDSNGQPTTTTAAVRQFEVSIKTISGVPGGPSIPDSLMAWVTLR